MKDAKHTGAVEKDMPAKVEPAKSQAEVATPPAKAKKDKKLKRKAPSGVAIRRITLGAKKARAKLDKVATTMQIEKDAVAGLKVAARIAGVTLKNDGKLSPLGHMSGKQNGLFDVAILTMDGTDFAGWVKMVAKANPTSRKSDLEDNVTFIKRLQSHFRFISGRKPSGVLNFPKRLAKVGLELKAEELMNALVAPSLLFDEYVAAGKF